MPKPIECDTVVCDLVLQAAWDAIPENVHELLPLPDCGELNRPLLPLIVALLDGIESTARAVDDNSWDSCEPLDQGLAQTLISQLDQIQMRLANATQAPAA